MDIADAGIPEPLLGVLEALNFREPSNERLCRLGEEQWDTLLDWCDRRQMTFVLEAACGDQLADRVQQRMRQSQHRYALRFARIREELATAIDTLDRRGISFVVLKGITHSPELTPDPLVRAQGDIDLWIPDGVVHKSREALAGAGYRTTGASRSDRHLPPMARPSAWRWRGDIFDPEMPVRIELHHHLWRSERERIVIPDEDQFRQRLRRRDIAGRPAFVLGPQDLCGFAALHFLLHLLHGDLPLQRAWEIARFLHMRAEDEQFWSVWRGAHGAELRQAESVVFEVVRKWFGCRVPECVEEAAELPNGVRQWLERFVFSSLTQQRQPNKHQVWLHMALIPSFGGRMRILLRHLLPVHAKRERIVSASRLRHHAATLLPTLLECVLWPLRGMNH